MNYPSHSNILYIIKRYVLGLSNASKYKYITVQYGKNIFI